jgi:hypothetical protein
VQAPVALRQRSRHALKRGGHARAKLAEKSARAHVGADGGGIAQGGGEVQRKGLQRRSAVGRAEPAPVEVPAVRLVSHGLLAR